MPTSANSNLRSEGSRVFCSCANIASSSAWTFVNSSESTATLLYPPPGKCHASLFRVQGKCCPSARRLCFVLKVTPRECPARAAFQIPLEPTSELLVSKRHVSLERPRSELVRVY